MRGWRTKNGFTLVEMSVVLVGIAIITGMGISAGIDVVETTRRVSTENKLDAIEQAFYTYRKQYNRLPCPGDARLAETSQYYGLAGSALGRCLGGNPDATFFTQSGENTPSGSVPVRSLGLPDEFMYDGWGRKFLYEVSPGATSENAFLYSQNSDVCSITINASGADLPISAAYTLVSYGKNGLGAYLKSGAQMDYPDNSSIEGVNVPQVNTNPSFHFKSKPTGKLGSLDYYDDIVRFKTRYQLMDDNDRNTPAYAGPDFVLSHDTGSGIQLVFGKRTCGTFLPAVGTFPPTEPTPPKFMAFTPNNNNLFVYHTDGAAGTCKLYGIIENQLGEVLEPTPVPNCPAAATKGALAHDMGTLVLNDANAPYLHAWSLYGSVSTARFAKLPGSFLPALTGAPDFITVSDTGDFVAVAKSGSYSTLFIRKPDGYKALTGMPDEGLNVLANAISPDGKYYAALINSGMVDIHVWRRIGGEFVDVPGSGITMNTANPKFMFFSPNSQFLAVGNDGSPQLLYIFNIDPQDDNIMTLSGSVVYETPLAGAFSSDSSFFALARDASDADSIFMYRRSGAIFYKELPGYNFSTSFIFNSGASANYVAMANKSNGLKTCLIPGGGSIASGDSITEFNVANGSAADCSAYELRYCNNGVLSGTYTNPTCDILP